MKDICSMCQSEDFGYCGLRDENITFVFEHNKEGNLIKCSEFYPDVNRLKRLHRIEEVEE